MLKYLLLTSIVFAIHTPSFAQLSIRDSIFNGNTPPRRCELLGIPCSRPIIRPSTPVVTEPPNSIENKISISRSHFSDVDVLNDIINYDVTQKQLSKSELDRLKEDFITLLGSIDYDGKLSSKKADLSSLLTESIKKLGQGDFVSSLTAFSETMNGLGQASIEAQTNRLIEKASPGALSYLVDYRGGELPSLDFERPDLDAEALKSIYMDSGISSHAGGISMSSNSEISEDGKWTTTDRAYAAVYQAAIRGGQAATVGAAAGGAIGSAVPGVGTTAGMITGGVFGAIGGAVWGCIEGFENPDMTEVKPSGITTKTDTSTSIDIKESVDEETGVKTTTTTTKTTVTVKTKNEETGEEETEATTVTETKEEKSCESAPCKPEDLETDSDSSYPNPYSDESGSNGSIQDSAYPDLLINSLIFTLEPRNKGKPLNSIYLKLRMESEQDALVNPKPDGDKDSGSPAISIGSQLDELINPKPDAPIGPIRPISPIGPLNPFK